MVGAGINRILCKHSHLDRAWLFVVEVVAALVGVSNSRRQRVSMGIESKYDYGAESGSGTA